MNDAIPVLLENIPVQIERRKVKYARLVVDHRARVRLIVPPRYPESKIRVFLDEKQTWIRKQLDYYERISKSRPHPENGEILYRGGIYHFEPLALGLGSRIDPDSRRIFSEANLMDARTLEEWYKREARQVILPRVAELARQTGFGYCRAVIRGQRSRWGSCSSRGNLSFNWRLIKVPDFVIDYVIVHELTHTQIMDHQKEFWRKLGEVIPDWKKARTWLRNTAM